VIDAQRGRLHLLFGHHKQWGPPEKNGKKPYLKCIVTDLSTLIESYNPKKTTHTFIQNNESFHTPKKRVPLKNKWIGSQFSIIYETYTRTWEMGKRVKENIRMCIGFEQWGC